MKGIFQNNNYLVNVYLSAVSVAGILLYISSYSMTPLKWSLAFTFITAILLLNHYTILLPPSGNSLSMDSAIYLAILFVFGLDMSLTILLFTSLIYAVYQKQVVWWKHLFNFSIYVIMIVSTYHSFLLTGGELSSITVLNISSYLASFSVYFLLNVLFIGLFFLLTQTQSLFMVIKGMLKETISSYLITLVLSLILVLLMKQQVFLGIFLFTLVAILLSVSFKQYFQLYQEVSEKADMDHLTELYNHGYFKNLLEKEIDKAKRSGEALSLGLLDLDDFKKYNDLHGHLQGDRLLKHFGAEMKRMAKSDFTVARYGGEEFAVLMPGLSQLEAYRFINQLRKQVNDIYFEGVEVLPHGCLSFSAGVIEYSLELYNSTEMIEKADQAMYFAKTKGKNNVSLYDTENLPVDTFQYQQEMDHLEQQLRIFLYKDVYTYRHSRRVYEYAIQFSNKLNLNMADRKTLIMGALIHDIGKLEIPRDVINKKGKLTKEEWEMVQKHVIWGREIVSTDRELHDLLPLVELHHERFDGKGYPYGMSGYEIPRLVRMLTVIDSFDAMTTERPYQETKSFSEAIDELKSCSGSQFDPQLVEAFIEVIEESPTLDTGKIDQEQPVQANP
ncbi:bifunctional diguanylate cyclase/phosphohydrolase [Alkalihalobacillus sp. CinArs1]|uniref:bifunctional diguanylate cyclase/phosphohydrolase n=1 Tax=Alkalihalobacillus sp. CinArs1 TaxID=2995314 RepID=UPI0022DDA638|nr:diguanylate cyclase [Alkalihalobacillus sp. CinArs1]